MYRLIYNIFLKVSPKIYISCVYNGITNNNQTQKLSIIEVFLFKSFNIFCGKKQSGQNSQVQQKSC